MRWYGYVPYQRFIRETRVVNPALASANALSKSPQEFMVQAAAVPYTNSPERASSTFIRNLRYDPYIRQTFVTIGNSQYYYPMGPAMLANWLTSKSLGQFYNNYVKLKR